MRKTLFVLLAPILLLPVGCQKSKDNLNTTKPTKKINDRETQAAADGAWDLLGYGYDVTKEYANSNSSTYPIINVEKLKQENPTRVDVSGAETTHGTLFYGENAEDWSSTLTKSVKLELGTAASSGASTTPTSDKKLFGGSITSSFKETNKFSSKFMYSSYNLLIVKKRVKFMPIVNLLKNYLTPSFISDVQNYNPSEIVKLYGTHVLCDIKLGGKLEVIYQGETSKKDRATESKNGVVAGVEKIFKLTTNIDYDKTSTSTSTNQRLHYRTIGGNSSQALLNTIPLNSSTPSIDISGWQNGVTDQNAELVDIPEDGLIPIYELIEDPTKKAALKSYTEQYMIDNQVYTTYEVSDIYRYRINPGFVQLSIQSSFGLSNVYYPINTQYENFTNMGVAFKAFNHNIKSLEATGLVPIYKYYNPVKKLHVFKPLDDHPDWIREDISFYAFNKQAPGTIPIYQYEESYKGFPFPAQNVIFYYYFLSANPNQPLENVYPKIGVSITKQYAPFYAYPL